jgi:hypothetical protein
MISISILRQRKKLNSRIKSIEDDEINLSYTGYSDPEGNEGVTTRGYDIFDHSGFENRIEFNWSNKYRWRNG